jgi:hypothetical protein
VKLSESRIAPAQHLYSLRMCPTSWHLLDRSDRSYGACVGDSSPVLAGSSSMNRRRCCGVMVRLARACKSRPDGADRDHDGENGAECLRHSMLPYTPLLLPAVA